MLNNIKTFESFDKEKLNKNFNHNRFGFDRVVRDFCDHMGYEYDVLSTNLIQVNGNKNQYMIRLEVRERSENYFMFRVLQDSKKNLKLKTIKDVLYNLQMEEGVIQSVYKAIKKINEFD